MRKIVITGGAGFIGSNLARHILEREDAEIVIVDDLSTGNISNIEQLDVDFRNHSILHYDELEKSVVNADVIVHLAAIPSVPRSIKSPRKSHDANATGTLNVLEAARHQGVKQVVAASSSSVYGSNPSMPKNESDWTAPMSPYAVSKLATETYTLAYGHSYGMETLAFRFFNVYGPGQAAGHDYAAVIPQFIDAALKGEPLRITGDGTQSRDFTYVDTVCATIYDAVSSRVSSPRPINLAFGTRTDLNTLVELVRERSIHDIEVSYVEPRVGDVKASQADGHRIREMFPRIVPVSLEEGLDHTFAWFRKQAEYSSQRTF